MATKLFFTRQSYTTINPGTIFTWGSSVKSVLALVEDTHATLDASYQNFTYSFYGPGTVLYRQWISPELAAGIVFNNSSTFEVCIRCNESSTSANMYMIFGVAIVSEDGTVIRDQFTALEKDGTEMSTTLTARANIMAGTSGISYTTVAGDHIVVEVGWDQDAAGSTYEATFSNGFLDDGGLSGDGDVGTDDPWINFSNTLTFSGGDPAPPATNEDWDVTAYIAGVCDEWV